MANWMVNNYRVSVQRACRCVRLPKSMYYYIHHRRDESLLKLRINESRRLVSDMALSGFSFYCEGKVFLTIIKEFTAFIKPVD